jgi:hypothetical protein
MNYTEIRHLIDEEPYIINRILKSDEAENFVKKEFVQIINDLNLNNVTAKKLYLAAYEFLENAYRQGVNGQDIHFLVKKNNANVFVLCENLIQTSAVCLFKEKLNELNKLQTKKDLKTYFKNSLVLKREILDGTSTGLFFLKRVTGSQYLYNFEYIDEQFTFFSLVTSFFLEK